MTTSRKSRRSAYKRSVEDKDDKPQVRQASSTDNRPPLIKEDVLMHHVNTIKGYNGKIDHLSGHRRNAFKAALAAGVEARVIKDIIAFEKYDPIKLRTYLEQFGVGLKATNAPVQLAVFDTIFDNPEDQAAVEGKADGAAGRAANCRWTEESPAHKAYFQAYHEANAKNLPIEQTGE